MGAKISSTELNQNDTTLIADFKHEVTHSLKVIINNIFRILNLVNVFVSELIDDLLYKIKLNYFNMQKHYINLLTLISRNII